MGELTIRSPCAATSLGSHDRMTVHTITVAPSDS
jgi:hypothetical protein